ncbi:MAG: zf-TFIIB domain-containing protein [Thermodesulfobacteriota bacterium]
MKSCLCPKCQDTPLQPARRNGVEIDYCPQCNGIWLDNGELNRIITRVGSKGGGKVISNKPDKGSKPAMKVMSSLLDILDLD